MEESSGCREEEDHMVHVEMWCVMARSGWVKTSLICCDEPTPHGRHDLNESWEYFFIFFLTRDFRKKKLNYYILIS